MVKVALMLSQVHKDIVIGYSNQWLLNVAIGFVIVTLTVIFICVALY